MRQLSSGPAKAEVAVWARSLTNDRDALYQLQSGTLQIDGSFQPARTYGVDFIVNF